MTRRIVVAITAVTVAAVVAFGLPLGVVVQRQYRAEAILDLERQATAATLEVPSTFAAEGDPLEVPEGEDGAEIGVYQPDGTKVAGLGPARAEAVVVEANGGEVAEDHGQAQLVVAVPVVDKETVFAVVRASQPSGALQARVERAWASMGALALGIVAAAFAVAVGLARRLQRPVQQLVESAGVLGRGDFTARAQRSGIRELDQAAEALDATAGRIGAIVERERAFSADASHQLRTPLTAMRVHLHQAQQADGDQRGALKELEADVDRLTQTTDDLLRLARDRVDPHEEVDLVELFGHLERRWHGPLNARDRELVLRFDGPSTVRASVAAVRQILDVLVDNATRHGAGTVTVAVRPVAGGTALDVHDDGEGPAGDPDLIFTRRSSDRPDHGIGLALARTLAEADGGRLLLVDDGPGTTFSLLLVGDPD